MADNHGGAPGWFIVAAGVFIVGALGVGIAAAATPPEVVSYTPVDRNSPAPTEDPKLTAVIIGDSYFAASTLHADPAVGDRVGDAMGWAYTNLALAGTGYLATGYEGENKPTYAEQVHTAAAKSPDVLLLEGGGNDRGVTGVDDAAAVLDATLTEARTLMPDTLIVVAGPLWTGTISDGDAWQNAYRDVLSRHPEIVWIDTVAAAWFPGEFFSESGERAAVVSADKVHPNDAGAELLATRMVEALVAAGVPQSQG